MSAALKTLRRSAFVSDDDGMQLSFDGVATPVRPVLREVAPLAAPRPVDEGPAGTAGRTLDDLLCGIWRELSVARAAPCPVCAAQMAPSGHCGGCGSTLS